MTDQTQPRIAEPEPDGAAQAGSVALDRFKRREEVLEICYWYEGEGLGDSFTTEAVTPFLPLPRQAIAETFDELAAGGDLEPAGRGFRFTETGKKKASRLFHETFAEFQTPSHYECTAGCCDSEDECDDDQHNHNHAHQHAKPST